MSLAISKLSGAGVEIPQSLDNVITRIANITFDSSYPTGGESLTHPDFADIFGVVVLAGTSGYELRFDAANNKLLVYAVDRSADLGTDNNNPLVQVPNTTDLSALAVTVLLVGTRRV